MAGLDFISGLNGFPLEAVFPLTTTIVSLLFSLSVLEQYLRKKKTHQLVWSIAMFLFFITAGAEAFSLLYGEWIPVVYRVYYALAAIQVTFMGAGVLYLFANRQVISPSNAHKALVLFSLIWILFSWLFFAFGHLVFLFILIPSLIMFATGLFYPLFRKSGRFSQWWDKWMTGQNFAHLFVIFSLYIFGFMVYYVVVSPLNYELLKTGVEVSGRPWQIEGDSPRALVRLFSPLLTVSGGIALIGGGIYSYVKWQLSIRAKKGHFEPRTGIYNLYIAVGAYVLAQGAFFSGLGNSIFHSVIGGIGTLYISEVISVLLMYFGFLESDRITKEKLVNALTMRWLWKREAAIA